MKHLDLSRDPNWLEMATLNLQFQGIAVAEGLLDATECRQGIQAILKAHESIANEISEEKIREVRMRGSNELRLVLMHDPFFLDLLTRPPLLQALDATLGDKAVLRFQNGEIAGGANEDASLPPLVQTDYHMNTQRVTPGSLLALDIAVFLTPFQLGIVPGSHQRLDPPPTDYLLWAEEILDLPAGSMVVFDPTLWHREVEVSSPEARYLVEQQFTKSYIKPHFDYPRALGEARMLALPERTRQLLGWHTRIPTSLQEFHLTGDRRLYRSDQG